MSRSARCLRRSRSHAQTSFWLTVLWSNRDYHVLFAEQDGSRAVAQLKAFENTWRWARAAAEA